MEQQEIAAEEKQEWLRNPVTKWYFSQVEEAQAALGEQLKNGASLAETPGLTAQLTARLVGELAGLNFLISKDFINDN